MEKQDRTDLYRKKLGEIEDLAYLKGMFSTLARLGLDLVKY